MDVLDHTLQLTAQDWGTVATFDWISAPKPKSNPGFPVIEVTQEKSQDAVLRFRGKDVTVLNFASGVSPGGGVRYGAKAQEEDLCLCSGLLHGLETLPKYYLANQAKKAPEDCYDIMIESEQVPFVKDGDHNVVEPFRARVFSYPAPNLWRSTITPQQAARTFRRRARQIIARATELGTEVLLLGAWGCGAYRNDPEVVARAFKEALDRFGGGLERVVFPVYGSIVNYEVFREVFK